MYTGVPMEGGGISGGSNHSKDGAKINYFDKTRGQTPVGGGDVGGHGMSSDVGGHTVSSGNNSGADGGTSDDESSGSGYSQNPAALAATWGDSQPRSSLINRIVEKFGGVIGGDGEESEEGGSFEYNVRGIVPVIAQPSKNKCWAAVTTMMLSWRDEASYSIEQAMTQAGNTFKTKYLNNETLKGSEKGSLLSAVGLVAEPPMNYSVDGMLRLLVRYGPLWVTTRENPSEPFSVHARIVTGMFGDGTPTGTSLRIIDPASGGRKYTETYEVLAHKFEERARAGIQVVHFPE
ncbi:hypothetical protein Elgi_74820 [Paenibacillus elgii]|nr:hypothetical protein Elgi_74820 [Paenibacillus elgii]